MGPFFERAVKTSVLPNDFSNLSKLSNEEMECLFYNRHAIDLLFENMDRELSDLIYNEDKLRKTRLDAHRLWKFLEAICEEDSDAEDQEEEEESLEKYTTTETCTHPLTTPPEDKGTKRSESAGFLLEPVRPV
jgi:hypothetical protein